MQKFSLPSPKFVNVKEVQFQRASSALEVATTFTAYDDVFYDVIKRC